MLIQQAELAVLLVLDLLQLVAHLVLRRGGQYLLPVQLVLAVLHIVLVLVLFAYVELLLLEVLRVLFDLVRVFFLKFPAPAL